MTFWLFSGSDQKSGDEISSLERSSCFFFWGGSKITPHGSCLFAERRIFAFQFF